MTAVDDKDDVPPAAAGGAEAGETQPAPAVAKEENAVGAGRDSETVDAGEGAARDVGRGEGTDAAADASRTPANDAGDGGGRPADQWDAFAAAVAGIDTRAIENGEDRGQTRKELWVRRNWCAAELLPDRPEFQTHHPARRC